MSDPIIRLNVVVSLAILLVLATRGLVRRRAGAGAAYGLWLLVPLAAAASFLPAREVVVVAWEAVAPATTVQTAPVAAAAPGFDLYRLMAQVWAAGFIASLALLVWRHERFLRVMGRLVRLDGRLWRAEGHLGGPALVGVIWPRIVVPAGFDAAYSPEAREVMLAHERTHLRRGDNRINAAAALAGCLMWFNPLVHWAVRSMRIDQELACDEAVVRRHPASRRIYAAVLLKSQLANIDLPLGCYWPAGGAQPLNARLSMLAEPAKTVAARIIGYAVVAGLMAGAGAAAWASQPAKIELKRVAAGQFDIAQAAPRQTRPTPASPRFIVEPPPLRAGAAPYQPSADGPMSSAAAKSVAAEDCERALRLGISPPQYQTCLRDHPTRPPGTPAERAIAAGDCDTLLRLERAADFVRCEQAHGRYLDVDPENPPFVSQSFSGGPPVPVRPLPPLPSTDVETRPLQAAWAEPVQLPASADPSIEGN
jgi:beta-lactamase regulating signal transducer with metallopeptidase domain